MPTLFARALPSDREISYSQASFFYDHYAAPSQEFLYVRQMIQQQFRLIFGAASGRAAEDDNRGLGRSSERQQRTEVRIRRDKYPVFISSKVEDVLVDRRLHPAISDVQCLVSGSSKLIGDDGRKSVIYEESQGAERSGISLSRTAAAA